MFDRPHGLLFWIVLAVLLFAIAVSPVSTAHAFLAVYHGIVRFFTGVGIFLDTLGSLPTPDRPGPITGV